MATSGIMKAPSLIEYIYKATLAPNAQEILMKKGDRHIIEPKD